MCFCLLCVFTSKHTFLPSMWGIGHMTATKESLILRCGTQKILHWKLDKKNLHFYCNLSNIFRILWNFKFAIVEMTCII